MDERVWRKLVQMDAAALLKLEEEALAAPDRAVQLPIRWEPVTALVHLVSILAVKKAREQAFAEGAQGAERT